MIIRLANEAERVVGDEVTTLNALEGPEFGHFRLTAPVPHPLAWGTPAAPIERLTGFDSETIWDVLTCKKSVVVGGGAQPVTSLIEDEAALEPSPDLRLEVSGAAIAACLADPTTGDAELRADLMLAGFEPGALMIQTITLPPGELWLEPFPTLRALYLRLFETSMRVGVCRHHHAPTTIMRDALSELARTAGFVFANGDRGLYTVGDRERCASLRDIAQAIAPAIDLSALMAGRTLNGGSLSADQIALLRALGMYVGE